MMPPLTPTSSLANEKKPELLNSPREVHCLLYDRASGKVVGAVALDQVKTTLAEQPDYFAWIYLLRPESEVLQQIKQDFGLHELAIEDTTALFQRTKIESYGDTLFVVFSTVNQNVQQDKLEFGSSNIFLTDRYIISVRQSDALCEKQVASLCEASPHQVMYGPAYIFYALMNCLVEQYLPAIAHLHERLQDLKQNIFTDKFHRQTLIDLYGLKEELTNFYLAVVPTKEVTCYLIAHQAVELLEVIPNEVIPYFRDIQDKVLSTLDIIQSQSEMQKSAMDIHMAQVSLSQNEIVKRLASWAAILAVPTLISSVYGMNFDNMPELHWPAAYFIVLVIMVAISSFLYYRLKQINWL
ncbi:magnesium and cobalt transport protein CorA [Alkanindiges illinoisensis]|uniref:Magnesium and cobalt transport protein CorA n=1 Tax=Alkanindiges illinoisensis TaxID=197183 RepID=A0A4Y7X9C1_9GAMM|nr:magnesium and cobalt transport protein CorA [Alkanindiges illinoisensis]TEU24236.1 magnesium and cobalt transport protein CorA [Alkanindiges illinoisensis]